MFDDYLCGYNFRKQCTGGIEFVKTDFLGPIDGAVAIVSGDSDYDSHYVGHPNHWGMNAIGGVHGIPTGIANPHHAIGDFNNLLDFQGLRGRTERLYVSFAINTNSHERIDAVKAVSNFACDQTYPQYDKLPMQHREYLKQMSRYKFVLSPAGNGVDCHRHWEAMYLGCIPIVKRTQQMNHFTNLPILFIDEWSDVTPDLLDNCDIIPDPNHPDLKVSTWMQKIRSRSPFFATTTDGT